MSYIAKPKVAHPNMPRNNLGLDGQRLRRHGFNIVCWLRSRLCHGGDRSGSIRTQYRTAYAGEDERHRLLIENARVFRQWRARI